MNGPVEVEGTRTGLPVMFPSPTQSQAAAL
jgi:hypothetical protein